AVGEARRGLGSSAGSTGGSLSVGSDSVVLGLVLDLDLAEVGRLVRRDGDEATVKVSYFPRLTEDEDVWLGPHHDAELALWNLLDGELAVLVREGKVRMGEQKEVATHPLVNVAADRVGDVRSSLPRDGHLPGGLADLLLGLGWKENVGGVPAIGPDPNDTH